MKPEHQGDAQAVFRDGPDIPEVGETQAIEAILAEQMRAALAQRCLSKSTTALRMTTSRRPLDRLLDRANDTVTLQRAANAVGRKLYLQLV